MSLNIAATVQHGSGFDLDDVPTRAEDYQFRVLPGDENDYILTACQLEIVRLEDAANHKPREGYQQYILDTRNPLYSWWQTEAHYHRLTQSAFVNGICQFVIELLKARPQPAEKALN